MSTVDTLKNVSYKEEIFELVHELRLIENAVIFDKDEKEENVFVKRINAEKNMAYILKAPISYFDFSGSRIAFYNFEEFYQFFKFMNRPEIKMDDTKIVMLKDNSKMNYMLSNPDVVKPNIKNVGFVDPQLSFKLTSERLEKITGLMSPIKPKRAKIEWDGERIAVTVFSKEHNNNYVDFFDADILQDDKEKFDFLIFFDTFTKLPAKKNYTVEIKSDGWSKYSLIGGDIQLDIYAGKAVS